MSTVLKIISWKSEGLRCPDHSVSFLNSADEVYPISLLQMPNGTGKTTTLELLRAALSGSAGKWDKDKIRSFRKRDSDDDRGSFQVTLLFNESRITLTLEFNFDDDTVAYSTTKPGIGLEKGFNPPRDLKKFLNDSFVNFFVFDGELAEQLLDRNYTNAQRIIEDLFQINLISSISSAVDRFWSSVAESKSAKEERGLSRRRNRVDDLKEILGKRKQERGTLEKERDKAAKALKKRNEQFHSELSQQREIREQLLEAERQYKDLTAKVYLSAKEVLDEIRNPHSLSHRFADEMATLKTSLDRVKLPESTAREFFEELADEERCICGRELDDDSRKAIKERSKNYLGSDDVSLLNQIKTDITNFIGPSTGQHEENLDLSIEALKSACQREMEAKTFRDQIEHEGVLNDPKLEKVRAEIDGWEQKLAQINAELLKYDNLDESASDSSTFGISILAKRLANAEKQLAEITQTIELKQKRDLLVNLLKVAQDRALQGLSEEIGQQANERISALMPDNAIRIESIDRCLNLRGQEGGSVGETLSVAYAFLATLFNRAEHQLPFVVDSPANPIDLKIRSKVAELIPKLADQFIAFTISSERQSFVSGLEKAAPGQILYLTLFRKGPNDLEQKAKLFTTTETDDGISVEGAPFFNDFHVDTEENNNVL
ncbi:MAG TPA: AAA family ATPase [Pyrinomonadaceae bacterium]|nr:AAA family ATPase [Pyrinomonadaceae bacterium]